MVLRVHKVPHPGLAEEEGQQLTPPTSCLGLQSVLLQFNQRSYCRVVEYVRWVKKRARTASPSRSGAQAEHGERPDKTVQAMHTEQDRTQFPKGSSTPNFGYHVRARLLACTTSRSPQGNSFSAGCAEGIGLPTATHTH